MHVSAYPPLYLLLVPAGMVLFVGLVLLLLPSTSGRRTAPMVVASILAAGVGLFMFSPARFAWDEAGIRDSTFAGTVAIPWTDVEKATVIPSFRGTRYRPERRTGGTGFPTYLSGHFTLASGKGATVFVMTGVTDALLLETRSGGTYLYAPEHVDELIATARAATGLLP